MVVYEGLYELTARSDMDGKIDWGRNTLVYVINYLDGYDYKLPKIFEFIADKAFEELPDGTSSIQVYFSLNEIESAAYSKTIKIASISVIPGTKQVHQRLYTRHTFKDYSWNYTDKDDLFAQLPLQFGFEQDRQKIINDQ